MANIPLETPSMIIGAAKMEDVLLKMIDSELENLLSYMIGTVDEDTTDDGFCENKITIRNVLKICKKHSGSEHKEHYKKVVKAGFVILWY